MPDDSTPPAAVPVTPAADPNSTNPNHDGTVSIDSHNKLLGEHKKGREKLNAANAQLEEFQKKERDREEAEQAKRGEHEKIILTHKERIAELESKEQAQKVREAEAKKFNAFFKSLDGQVDEKYWSLIDVSGINMDPDTGQIDDLSVANTVEKFKNEYSPIIQGAQIPNLPNAAPSGSATPLSIHEWKKLPLAERKERMAEVFANHKK